MGLLILKDFCSPAEKIRQPSNISRQCNASEFVLLAVATIGVHSFFSINCFCYSVTKLCLCETLFLSRDSLRLHGLQHTRLLCPLLFPRLCSNSYPLSWWCHVIISSSAAPFSFCLQSFQHQVLYQWVSSLHQWPNYWTFSFKISPSEEYSGLISFRIDWFDLLGVQGTLKSLLQHHNSKASILRHSAFFMVQLSYLYMTIGKTIALTICTFVGKVMSPAFEYAV